MSDVGFTEWFEREFANKTHPWKDSVRAWKDLPASFRSLTFTQALADWRHDHEQSLLFSQRY